MSLVVINYLRYFAGMEVTESFLMYPTVFTFCFAEINFSKSVSFHFIYLIFYLKLIISYFPPIPTFRVCAGGGRGPAQHDQAAAGAPTATAWRRSPPDPNQWSGAGPADLRTESGRQKRRQTSDEGDERAHPGGRRPARIAKGAIPATRRCRYRPIGRSPVPSKKMNI